MNIISSISSQIDKCEFRLPPVVIRVNKFDEESAREFSQQLSAANSSGQPVAPVIIDSYGGQIYALMSMIDAINGSKIPVATIVEGKAMSCGAALLTCGAKGMRYASPNSTIMIHEASNVLEGKTEELKSRADYTDKLNQKMLKIMSKNVEKEEDYFYTLLKSKNNADWFISATEAQKLKIVNHVRLPTFTVNVNVQYNFK